MPLIFFFTWWDSGQTFHTPTKYMKFTLSIPPIIFSPNAVPYQVIHSHVCLPTIPSSFFFIVFVTCFSLYATSQTMSSSKKARTESHFYFISDPVLNLALAHGSTFHSEKNWDSDWLFAEQGISDTRESTH